MRSTICICKLSKSKDKQKTKMKNRHSFSKLNKTLKVKGILFKKKRMNLLEANFLNNNKNKFKMKKIMKSKKSNNNSWINKQQRKQHKQLVYKNKIKLKMWAHKTDNRAFNHRKIQYKGRAKQQHLQRNPWLTPSLCHNPHLLNLHPESPRSRCYRCSFTLRVETHSHNTRRICSNWSQVQGRIHLRERCWKCFHTNWLISNFSTRGSPRPRNFNLRFCLNKPTSLRKFGTSLYDASTVPLDLLGPDFELFRMFFISYLHSAMKINQFKSKFPEYFSESIVDSQV